MTTTIELPEALYDSARQMALSSEHSFSQWISRLLIYALETRLAEKPPEDFTEWRDELLK